MSFFKKKEVPPVVPIVPADVAVRMLADADGLQFTGKEVTDFVMKFETTPNFTISVSTCSTSLHMNSVFCANLVYMNGTIVGLRFVQTNAVRTSREGMA